MQFHRLDLARLSFATAIQVHSRFNRVYQCFLWDNDPSSLCTYDLTKAFAQIDFLQPLTSSRDYPPCPWSSICWLWSHHLGTWSFSRSQSPDSAKWEPCLEIAIFVLAFWSLSASPHYDLRSPWVSLSFEQRFPWCSENLTYVSWVYRSLICKDWAVNKHFLALSTLFWGTL